MGLGSVFTRQRPQQTEDRVITEFAIIDGNPIFGTDSTSSYRGALSIPGAWRASNLIADLLGSVPWQAYRQFAGRPVEKLEPTPPLLEQPSPPDSRVTTFTSLALDLVWHGNAVAIVASRNSDGWPTSVYPVPADMVTARRVTDPYGPLPIGTIEYSIGGRSFTPDQVIHVKGPCPPGAMRGLGVLEAHLSGGLELAKEQIRQALALADHGVPTGYIQAEAPNVTTDELRDLKRGWLESQRTRTVAALNATTKFVPLSWNPEELELLDARKFSLHEIGLMFGVPLYFLGVETGSETYSNVEQEGLNLLKYSLNGHLARFEAALSLAYPRGTTVKANLDSILRADTKTRYEAHQIGLTAGFLQVNEVRDLEDLPPIETPEEAA